jgi:hypothetical protein
MSEDGYRFTWSRGDEVFCRQPWSFNGMVLGYVQKKDGVWLCCVETNYSGQIFFVPQDNLKPVPKLPPPIYSHV